jgi:hypothetical protein
MAHPLNVVLGMIPTRTAIIDQRRVILFAISQRGRSAAVTVSMDACEKGECKREMPRQLLRGEHEVAARLGHDLDDVLAEADRLLADDEE